MATDLHSVKDSFVTRGTKRRGRHPQAHNTTVNESYDDLVYSLRTFITLQTSHTESLLSRDITDLAVIQYETSVIYTNPDAVFCRCPVLLIRRCRFALLRG
ncbi:hypothetical protein LSH36_413g01003 [Paralvinella palmiformis]|uniref:Uncharacterized protein n=1 Tax=Paralvinella palmiformis TaxID=53620 RepID=A0AAD9N111_9ANNE|nr:hypothetical protein LSH36_413g01003 [Paralvinella palmiformis]